MSAASERSSWKASSREFYRFARGRIESLYLSGEDPEEAFFRQLGEHFAPEIDGRKINYTKVLPVDDEEAAREVVRKILQEVRAGYPNLSQLRQEIDHEDTDGSV